MIDEGRRIEIYNIAFKFLIDNRITTIPVWTEELCQNLNIELVKLSDIVRSTKFSKEEIFSFWGNEDGVLHSYKGKCKIAFNDEKSIKRQRFTIMEEISHKVLGHIFDDRFNIFSQTYDEPTYRRYEEEARMCAGIILCPPQFYYDVYHKMMPKNLFKVIYNVSEPCAATRIDILSKFEYEIKRCELYKSLPKVVVDNDYIAEVIFA